MTRVGTVFLDLAVNAEKAGKDLAATGKQLSTNLSAPLLAAGGLAVRQFAGFETSLSRITGLSGVAQEQVQAWTGDVKQTGVEYAQGAKAAGEALYFITSSGVQGSAAIDTLRESSKAAAAGLGETQTIADLTTSALNAYKGTGLDAARATDILTAAVASGKGEPAEFAQSLGQVLPIASALGVSYDQVAGAEAAMTLRGLDAGESTTALRGIFTTLLKPTQQAEEALAGVGLSSEGLRKQLKDQGLLATLETMTSALGDDASASAAVFENVRALNGVMNILGANTDDTRRVMDEVANSTGRTDEAFQAASSTAEFKLQQGLQRVNNALIEVGGQLAPVAEAFGSMTASVAESFGHLPAPIQTGTLAVLGMAAAIGPTTFVVGKLVSTFGLAVIAARDFAVGVSTANAAAVSTNIGRFGALLGAVPIAAAAATAGVIALAAGYAILSSKMRDAESIGDPLKKIGDTKIKNAKSFQDLQDVISKANSQTAELQKRFDDIHFDPVEREAIGSMGAALAESATQAAKFSGQASRISDVMGVSKDAAAVWVVEQAKLGHTFENADFALAAYRQSVSATSAATEQAATATGKLAATAGPLADPFFNLQTAQRGYESSLRSVVTAQRQAEQAQRGVDDAVRQHETAIRKVGDAEARQRQSLRAVADAQRDVTAAQKALNDALRGPSDDQQLNVEGAELAVARARQRLSELGKAKPGEKAEPVDPLDRREAQLNVRRAENDLQRVQAEVSNRVATAQDNLRGAQDRLADSQRQADDAALAVADAHRQVGDALRGISDARVAAEDAVRGVGDAQAASIDAARNLAGAQETFMSALGKAPGLAGSFISYLENMRDRFPEVGGNLQGVIDKFRELQALAPPPNNPYAALQSNSFNAPLNQPVGSDSADGRAYGGPVNAGQVYEVNELGVPELFVAGGRQYVLPTVDGTIVPSIAAQAAPGGGPQMVIEHLEVHGPDPVATSRRMVTDLSKKAAMAAAR